MAWGFSRPLVRLAFSPSRRVGLLALDGGIAALSLWLAMSLRFDTAIPPPYLALMPEFTFVLVLARIVSALGLRLHRWSFNLAGFTDAVRVILAGLFGTGLFLTLAFLGRVGFASSSSFGPPRSVLILEFFLSTTMMAVVRFSPRLARLYALDISRAKRGGARTLIVGAGATGEMLLRDLHRSNEHNHVVLGFVDDDEKKGGMLIGGRPVFGPIEMLPEIVRTYRISDVLIAIPRMSPRTIRTMLALCADLKVRFKIVPVSYLYLADRGSFTILQDLQPEDLLLREPVAFSRSALTGSVTARVALVTGAAGSIGSEICLQLAASGLGSLVMVDLNENGLYLLQRRLERDFPGLATSAQVADIRDYARIESLLRRFRPADVFHAAAHKHVPLMEDAPCEAVKNNILGTRNVALAAHRCGAERFVYISTDKAVRPTSVMGVSKRVGEKIIQQIGQESQTRFCCVRFGNVLDSAGSVVPLFRQQIAAGRPVTVTDTEVHRYFMTISEAVGLVLLAGYGDYGELCVLDMGEQISILSLARHMITMAGLVPDVDVPIVITGLRPGEKLYEQLLTEEEEQTRRVHDRILVATYPAPPSELNASVERLEAAACAEDTEEVVRLLAELVPTFSPAAGARPQRSSRPTVVGPASAIPLGQRHRRGESPPPTEGTPTTPPVAAKATS